MSYEIKFWNGHPRDGGQEIPGELTHMDDGTFTFRPYVMPPAVTEIYVSNEDGDHVTLLPMSQMAKPPIADR